MGSESVELVRRVYIAWQEGDLEELLTLVDREVSWSPVLRFLEGEKPALGHQGIRRWFRRIRITYRSLRVVPESFEDHGDRVLVLGRLVGASRLEEGELDVHVAWMWTVRAGRAVEMKAFLENARREKSSSYRR
jgi:ketosteroid isomerase-like protein